MKDGQVRRYGCEVGVMLEQRPMSAERILQSLDAGTCFMAAVEREEPDSPEMLSAIAGVLVYAIDEAGQGHAQKDHEAFRDRLIALLGVDGLMAAMRDHQELNPPERTARVLQEYTDRLKADLDGMSRDKLRQVARSLALEVAREN